MSREFDIDPDDYVREKPGHQFLVRTEAYTDADVFELEMRRIFERTWIYVGHESELPDAGSFKTAQVGRQPIIVLRDKQGGLGAFFNRCVHRGAALLREAEGTVQELRCPYHGWVFDLSGKTRLVSERNDPGGYGPGFEQPEGLVPVPRLESYRGLLFVSMDPQIVPLERYLGLMKEVIDAKLDLSPTGRIVVASKPYVARYQGNWKLQTENIVDAYHFMHTHGAFVKLQAKFGDTTGDFGVHKGRSTREMREQRFRGATWSCLYGHGYAQVPAADTDALLDGEFGGLYRALHAQHGDEGFARIASKVTSTVFPSMGMIHQQIRVWRPISPEETEVLIYPYEIEGAPEAFNAGMLRSQERFYGPSGFGMTDDTEIFARVTQGLRADHVKWLVFDRGMDTDEQTASGDFRGLPSSEAPQRALWREWSRLMRRSASEA
ncbi:2-halobenzoate 1,2-dioxygenase large subunit [Pigmentiphaga humi]|uniref:2-halobenzoate 1,2-dioxygenase large subunit n=1 Tax=Pigmentiphaga humi TaxID=2478468 RepID=A0A3P4B5V8_9BURK|nr:Rieske 2Fe-2S domain-containing protein [Pigmentiphaga humi]VCU71291.1 2-halobenzoate 1,2-dioxygenase large subunit [Pigmentiphaga humi]